MTLPESTAARIADAAAFIFDMDGTIALGDAASGGHKPLPHATELISKLGKAGRPFIVFTNGTAKPPADYAASLRNAGFALDDAQMMTPSSSAAAWYKRKGIDRVRVLGTDGVSSPLRDLGIETVAPDAAAKDVPSVYTGWFREFTFPALEAACDDLWEGASLTTASHVPFFATENGRAIGSSFAINAMLRAMTGKRATILGKPSRAGFQEACRRMGIARKDYGRVVVFGDDPALEMRMANSVGAVSVGLTTGLMKRDATDALALSDQPTVLLDHLKPVLDLI